MARSFRGKEVDMLKLFHKNEKKIALGNARMNARGDIIGRGGIILKSREDQVKEYQEKIKEQEGTVGLKDPEALSDLEKKLRKVSKPEKVVAKKKKEEPKQEPIAEPVPEKEEEIIYDE